jgi:hypothetical protein
VRAGSCLNRHARGDRRCAWRGAITVTDDWPEIVPITDAELRVMEAISPRSWTSFSGREPDGRQKLEVDLFVCMTYIVGET